jgi:hypothetical protein
MLVDRQLRQQGKLNLEIPPLGFLELPEIWSGTIGRVQVYQIHPIVGDKNIRRASRHRGVV